MNIYLGKRDEFYCVAIEDVSVTRDNKILTLFEETIKIVYHSPDGPTTNICCAKFWKDKNAVIQHMKSRPNRRIIELSTDEFIDSIPDTVDSPESSTITYLKNLDTKQKEIEYSNAWTQYRKMYKATSFYKKVKYPQSWLRCKNCYLIPLVREFDNGSSTACGCGENQYIHHSISSESIMSYVTRNDGSAFGFDPNQLRRNWNQWVKTGQDIFSEEKKKNDKLW